MHFTNPVLVGSGFVFFLVLIPFQKAIVISKVVKQEQPAVDYLIRCWIYLHAIAVKCNRECTPSSVRGLILSRCLIKFITIGRTGEVVSYCFILCRKFGTSFSRFTLKVTYRIPFSHGDVIFRIKISSSVGILCLG